MVEGVVDTARYPLGAPGSAGFVIHRLCTNPLLQRFVAACMGLPAVHPLADPLAGPCLNVIPPGRAHPWRFDPTSSR